MSLPSISIKRPVFALMLNLFFIIFGIISFNKIGVQQIPNINFPTITITTNLPGGNPTLINKSITQIIESSVNSIAGVKHVYSSSEQGKSTVQLEFALGTDMGNAYNQVENKVNEVQGELPSGVKSPMITRESANSDPIMLLALYGQRSAEDLDNLARNVIKPKLENIQGVGSVNIQGSNAPSVKINLDLAKMTAMQVTPSMVEEAISTEHVDQPGGMITSGNKLYNLNLDLEYHTIDQLGNLTVAYRDNAPIHLNNIATITYSSEDDQSAAQYNGQKTVGLSIVKKGDGNTVEITASIKEKLKTEIKSLLPADVHLTVVYAAADYILKIIHSLESDIWLSILSAGLIIFLFLRNLRSTFIIITAMPVSILGVVTCIYFLGYTFNIITLLGLILLIGVVVDDAIVVLENIFRHGSELKQDRIQAAIDGTHQVQFAVVASSLTLISIFIPVIFMAGIIGLFFRSFAVVVTLGVIISLFVSLTLTPMLCSRFLSMEEPQGRIYSILEKAFQRIDAIYKRMLDFSLSRRWLIVLLAGILVLISLPIFHFVGKAFMPDSTNTGTFYIKLQAPQGSSKDYTAQKVTEVETLLRQYKDVGSFYSTISPANQASITVNLAPSSARNLSQQELMSIVQHKLQLVPGVVAFVSTSGQAGSMTFALMGPDYNQTLNQTFTLYNALAKYQQLGSPYIDLSYNQPSYMIELDRELARSLNISAKQITDALTVLGNGEKIAHFSNNRDGQRSDIILKTQKGQFNGPEDLNQIYLESADGKPVRIDTVVNMYETLSPVSIQRQDLAYAISFSTTPKISMDKAIALVKKVAAQVLPKGYYVTMTGDTASLQSTVDDVLSAFALIILLIYMVLASQFNSFIQPLIILVAQPLALIGGILVLWIFHQTLNIYSMIGILLLMGLVAKNSILLIDLTNQKRIDGKSITEALKEACPLRMRPVVMTSMAIIFAMLPAAIIPGAGSEAHRPLALVIIGGMISSTLLTLIVVPALYSLVEHALEKYKKI